MGEAKMKRDALYRDLPDSFLTPQPPHLPPPPKVRRRSWPLTLSVLVWLGTLGTVLWAIVPKFAAIFRQVDVPLPILTRWILSASGWVQAYPWVWMPAGVILAWIVGRLGRRVEGRLSLVVLLLMAMSAGLVVWAVLAPLLIVMHGIGTV
jgi:type II secretory pathway component PulF